MGRRKFHKRDISRPIPCFEDVSKIEKFQIPYPIQLIKEDLHETYGDVNILTRPNLPGGVRFPGVKDFISGPIRIEKFFRGVPCTDPREHLYRPDEEGNLSIRCFIPSLNFSCYVIY